MSGDGIWEGTDCYVLNYTDAVCNFLWGYYIGQTGRDSKTCYEDKM